MNYILYGDGIHDDYPAIQEMLDGGGEVTLPQPVCHYTLSQTLVLPAGVTLRLPATAVVRLMDGANCLMVRNRWVPDKAERLPADCTPLMRHLWYYVDEYSPDAVTEDITIIGGIWDCNNMGQLPNPERTPGFGPHGFTGEGMLFYGVRNLTLRGMTIKDPTHWGVSLDRVTDFTVEDITFDYNLGNPAAINMDGIHLNGNCHRGKVRHLRGACYDDMVAINAHEGSRGPITDIDVDDLQAEVCHSAVRLLTVADDVRHIRITNVSGTYYQYCIGLTKYYPGETTGRFDDIVVEHVHAAKASREGIYPAPNSYVYPFLYIQENTLTGTVTFRDVYRREETIACPTVFVGAGATVEHLVLDNVVTENCMDVPVEHLLNEGTIHTLEQN